MRFSPNRFAAFAAAAAALLLAACAGRGMVPSGTAFAPSAPAAKGKATPSPCKKTQQPWIFGGACGTVTLATTGGTASMKAYKGYTLKAKFTSGAPNGTVLVVRDATGKGDATGTVGGKAFPQFTYSGLKPLLYLKAHNQGVAFNFSGVPQITVTSATGFPGKTCLLTKMLANGTWSTGPLLNGQIKGNTLTFGTIVAQQKVPKNGTIYLAISCH
jgi:hypothetical protein